MTWQLPQNSTDFVVSNGKLALSSAGNAACGTNGCANIKDILKLQEDTTSGVPNHSPSVFRSKLTGWYNAQVNRLVKHGDPLFELEEISAGASPATAGGAPVVSEAVVVGHTHGIHARPAALIAKAAKAFPFELEIRARGRGASARSAVALMSLGIRGGDELVITGFESAAAAGASGS